MHFLCIKILICALKCMAISVSAIFKFHLCIDKIYALVHTAILIKTLITQVKDLSATVEKLVKEKDSLKLKLTVYKNKKNSRNSHVPQS